MKISNNKKGITLIALVITIIILLILAGVSVSLITGNNSTLQKAIDAKEKTEQAKSDESERLDEYGRIVNQHAGGGSSEREETVYTKETLVFDGNEATFQAARTGVKLFSAENIDKDFEIAFTFGEEIVSGQANTITILNSSDEVGATYVGFYVRISDGKILLKGQRVKNGTKTEIRIQENDLKGKELKIVRIDGTIYAQYNGKEEKLLDNPESNYDTELTFGGIIGKNGADRLYIGNLYNISVKFEDEVEEDTEIELGDATSLAYKTPRLNTNSGSYINTEINLFDAEHIEKDFIVLFNIDEVGTNSDRATLFNAFVEKDGEFRGVLLRYQDSKIHLEVNNGSGKKPVEWEVTDISQITMKRVDGKFYYSINNSKDFTLLEDLSSITPHSIPVTFGCSMDSSKNPPQIWRKFKGILSNIKIYIEP